MQNETYMYDSKRIRLERIRLEDWGQGGGWQFGQFKAILKIEQNLQFAAEVEKSIRLISFANSYSNGREESDEV